MGSHWVQKMIQSRKKLPCPKIRFLPIPRSSILRKKWKLKGPSWGQWGPIGSKKWVKTVKITMPQNSNFRLPRGHRFFAKNGSYGYRSKSPWDPLRSMYGPMGSHWVQKMGQNRKKLPCTKIRIFDYLAVIDFSEKMEGTVMAPNHGGDSVGSILGPKGSHWVKKNGSKLQKITMPSNSNFQLPRSHQFFPKNGSFGYSAKSRWGPARVHLGANGVPLGPKNGSKP